MALEIGNGEEDRANRVDNRAAARARQLSGLRPFQRGNNANPRGRPKADFKLADLARVHAPEAIATLVSVMKSNKATPSARVAAASELLDRGFGRSPQFLDMNIEMSLGDEFEQFIRELQSNRGREPAERIEAQALQIDAQDDKPVADWHHCDCGRQV